MAQAVPGFDADAFRTGIRTAMLLGLPDDPERRPQFVTEMDAPLSVDMDELGVPWDPSGTPAPAPDLETRVLCAIEWLGGSPVEERFGSRQPSVVHLTLLDQEYAQIEGFTYVRLWPTITGAPVKYFYRKVLQQVSLDTVGVWQLECATEDTQ